MFSSDPRIAVVFPNRPGQTAGTWRLQISQASVRDEGEYQCQVNSEPKESADVTLVARGDDYQHETLCKVIPIFQEKMMS